MSTLQHTPAPEKTIELKALSDRQRRLVERHLPLIWLTLQRHFTDRRPRAFHRMDLHQEGCMALADAIKSHDPHQHGDFPSFAMARIHFAMNKHRHENTLIRVPYITQRRRRSAAGNDRHDPGQAPKTYLMTAQQLVACPSHDRLGPRDDPHPNGSGPSLGDLVRDCCDNALQQTVAEESASATTTREAEALERCAGERWSIPEPDYRMPYRELAQELDCPRSRIVRHEDRVMRKTRERLRGDPRYDRAIRMANRRRAGLRYVPTAEELHSIESMNNTG